MANKPGIQWLQRHAIASLFWGKIVFNFDKDHYPIASNYKQMYSSDIFFGKVFSLKILGTEKSRPWYLDALTLLYFLFSNSDLIRFARYIYFKEIRFNKFVSLALYAHWYSLMSRERETEIEGGRERERER